MVIMIVALGLWQGALVAREKDRREKDFGAQVQKLLNVQSNRLFGVKQPLAPNTVSAECVSCLKSVVQDIDIDILF